MICSASDSMRGKLQDCIKKQIVMYREVMGRPVFILAVCGLLFCILTMYYADMTVTGQFSVMMWDSLFDGRTFSFYSNCLNSGIAPEGAVYDIGLYIIFAIWCFPVWVLNKIAGISTLAAGSLIWYKLLPVICVLISAGVVSDISEELGISREKASYSGMIYLFSSTVILPVFVTAQYDSLPLLFILMGIRSWLRGKQRKFLVWFSISLVLKPLGILILFLLIIYEEKNVFHIIIDLLKACSLLIICKLICSVSSDYRLSTGGFLGKNLPDLMKSEFSGGYGEVSVFCLGIVVVYFVAYMYGKKADDDIQVKRNAFAMCFLIWAVFCAFGHMTPYWTIYVAPFGVVCAFLCADKVNRMLMLDVFGNLALTCVLILGFSWVYGGDKTYSYLILKSFCTRVNNGGYGTTVAGLLNRFSLGTMDPFINAVILGWLAVEAYCTFSSIRRTGSNTSLKEPDESSVVIFGHRTNILWLHVCGRVILLWVWIVVTLAALYVTNR